MLYLLYKGLISTCRITETRSQELNQANKGEIVIEFSITGLLIEKL